MSQPRPWSSLIGLLVLSATAGCRLFFNRGILFPCVFFEKTTGKLLILYGLQQEEDLVQHYTVSPSPGLPQSSLKVTLNFCKMTTLDKLDTLNLQSQGSSYIEDTTQYNTYALSYSDGYLSSTSWSFAFENDANENSALVIRGDNNGTSLKTKIVQPTIRIYCDQAITTAAEFRSTLNMTKFTTTPSPAVTFEGRSKHACGISASFILSTDIRIIYGTFACLGFLLLILGYCILKWTITLSLFLLGCCLAASEIFDNSTIGTWGKFAWIIFSLIIIGLGFSFSYSGYYFPTGAIYLFAIYIGHLAASALSDYFSMQERFYVGYLLVHATFLFCSLAVFRKNLNNCKFCFTASLGGWCLLFAYTNLRYNQNGLYLDAILKPSDVFKAYPLTSLGVLALVFFGIFCQTQIFKKQAEQEGANAEIEEFMQQQ
jgi:hypothetical protein